MSESNADECWRLNVPAGPAAQEGLELGLGFEHLVRGQLDHRHVEGGQRRGGVEVAAFLGLPSRARSSGA